MKFYILDNGYMKTDKNNVVAGSNTCTRKNPNVKNQFYNLPVMCVLVEHDGRYILYDTGCNMMSMRGYWDEDLQDRYELHQTIAQNLEVQLAKCGVRKEQIDIVVISHMHFDHTGNISMFPNAKFYVPKADFEYAKQVFNSSNPNACFGYLKKDIDLLKNFTPVSCDFELCPRVEIKCLPGHAPGVLGMVLHLKKEGTFIFPMDAVYTTEIYGPPSKAAGLVFNREQYFASIEKVRFLQNKYNAKVIPAHDWDVFETLKKAPRWYE